MRSNVRTFATCLGIGTLIALVLFLIGSGLEFAGFFKVALLFLWPYVALKGLAPCLPAGDANCVGDTIQSGVFFLSFGISVAICAAIVYGILRMTSNNRSRGP
jgi:hypothetical protein